MAKGGENALREQLIQWFDAHVPGGWWLVDAQTMLYELMEDEEWLSYAQHDIDLGLFLGVIRTIQHMKARLQNAFLALSSLYVISCTHPCLFSTLEPRYLKF